MRDMRDWIPHSNEVRIIRNGVLVRKRRFSWFWFIRYRWNAR